MDEQRRTDEPELTVTWLDQLASPETRTGSSGLKIHVTVSDTVFENRFSESDFNTRFQSAFSIAIQEPDSDYWRPHPDWFHNPGSSPLKYGQD